MLRPCRSKLGLSVNLDLKSQVSNWLSAFMQSVLSELKINKCIIFGNAIIKIPFK